MAEGTAVKERQPPEFFTPERVLAFSDGVFAVAITLLVIDLRLPSDLTGGDAALVGALLAMGSKLLIFAFTFVVVGMSWLGHHQKFSYVRRVDRGLLWLNLFYLLTLCLVPFATSVLSEHGSSPVTFILYASVMALVLSLSAILSAYSLREPYLGGSPLRRTARRDMILSPLLTGAIFLASAGLAAGRYPSAAHWALLGIVPVNTYLGSQARRSAGEEANSQADR